MAQKIYFLACKIYFKGLKIIFEYRFIDVFSIGFIMFFLGFPKHLSIWKLKPFIKEPIALSCKVKKGAPPKGYPKQICLL